MGVHVLEVDIRCLPQFLNTSLFNMFILLLIISICLGEYVCTCERRCLQSPEKAG